jgi:hypothetical protein
MANGTTLNPDGSMSYPNGSRSLPDGTLIVPNVTASSVLPYEIKLDGSYGVLGGVLIVTGAPVCVLGGKNRWSVATSCSVYVARAVVSNASLRALPVTAGSRRN